METYALGISGVIIMMLFTIWRSSDGMNTVIKILLFFIGMFDVILWSKRVGVL